MGGMEVGCPDARVAFHTGLRAGEGFTPGVAGGTGVPGLDTTGAKEDQQDKEAADQPYFFYLSHYAKDKQERSDFNHLIKKLV